MPKVSVCCSVLNQSAWLEDMIASVFAQTFEDWELIIVDDGSTESIPDVINKFNDERGRVQYHRFAENKGIPWGINHAFQMASGEYVQPLAADEVLYPEKLAIQVKYLDENPDIAACWGLPRNGELGKRPLWEQYALKAGNRNRAQWIDTFVNLRNVPLGGCSALWRRKVFDTIGLFDCELTAFSDHEFYVRLIENFEIRVLPYRFALSRPAQDSVSANTPENAEKFRRELEYVRARHTVPDLDDSDKVTFGIPVRNMEKFVAATLQSVLDQTHHVHEIIVVDDASTDGTADAVMAFQKQCGDTRIKLHRLPENVGAADATNYALQNATGDLFVALSADDLIDQTYVEQCLEIFKVNPHVEMVASQTDFIDAEGNPYADDHPFKRIEPASNKSRDEWLARLYHGNVYFGVGMQRTKALREIGGWKKEYKVISDYEVYLALLQRGPIYIIEKPLTHTRIHGNNQSIGVDQEWLHKTYAAIKQIYYSPRRKLMIGTPFYESRGWSPYINAIAHTVKMLTAMGFEHQFVEVSGDSYVHRAKNTLLARFLEDEDATDLLMVDSDMYWNADALATMLMLPEEIIVGSYPQKNSWEMWTSLPKFEKTAEGRTFIREKKLSIGGSLMLGQDLAGGFVLIKKPVLKRFIEHYPDLWYTDPSADPQKPDRKYVAFYWPEIRENRFWGEDRIFSRRLAEMKQEWWIYTNIHFSHWGVRGWDGNFMEHMEKLKSPDQTIKESEIPPLQITATSPAPVADAEKRAA